MLHFCVPPLFIIIFTPQQGKAMIVNNLTLTYQLTNTMFYFHQVTSPSIQ